MQPGNDSEQKWATGLDKGTSEPRKEIVLCNMSTFMIQINEMQPTVNQTETKVLYDQKQITAN